MSDKVDTLRFAKADAHWWRKPLVMHGGRATTAELAILDMELGAGEQGVWLNSSGAKSGVVDLVADRTSEADSLGTRRVQLPTFVSRLLEKLYIGANSTKGCPDLVIWCTDPPDIRLVEVKNPGWDKLSREQEQFISIAAAAGIHTKLVEWEFEQT